MTATAPLVVALRDVVLGYRRPLLPPVSLDVASGDFVGVVGPNASGKSTLLKTLCGVLSPLAGEVIFPDGRPFIGYVPQRGVLDDLFPLSAREVVALNLVPGLPLFGQLRARHLRTADNWLERLGLDEVRHVPFRELSGGQRQRTLLARALVLEPALLVLDEPTAALDPVAEGRLLTELSALSRDREITIVLVSHQLERTASVARRLVIVDRDRQVVRVGPTDEIVTADVLSSIYGAPVIVETTAAGTVVRFDPEGASDA